MGGPRDGEGARSGAAAAAPDAAARVASPRPTRAPPQRHHHGGPDGLLHLQLKGTYISLAHRTLVKTLEPLVTWNYVRHGVLKKISHFSVQIGDGCQLSSAGDVAAAVHEMVADISIAEDRAC